MSADPYVYPGSRVLINKEDIRDSEMLEAFERTITANRMEHLPARIPMHYPGYRRLHRHLFEPIYSWAGKERTVNIAKGGHLFCLVPFIAAQMEQRFAAIRSDDALNSPSPADFAARAAEHICEINAIHPFRDGNGRTLRAFLECLARAAGHTVALRRIDPEAWNAASISSFKDGCYNAMRQVVTDLIVLG